MRLMPHRRSHALPPVALVHIEVCDRPLLGVPMERADRVVILGADFALRPYGHSMPPVVVLIEIELVR